MRVRFAKRSGKADLLTCVRDDGSETTGEMPKQGILPHDAFHYVVETTLDWRDSFFGQVACGISLDHITAKLHREKVDWSRNVQALQCESLVECLQAEQWGGAADLNTFMDTLAVTCRRRGVDAPRLTTDQLRAIKAALRSFGAEWRPLAPGAVLEKTF
ncbi:MAG TPA: hypothetical protein VKC60_12825 [Opitutaceae bacterium]|nr:hypothetical protein [Opitutaceae bacterium]